MRATLAVLVACGGPAGGLPPLPDVADPCATWPAPGRYALDVDGGGRDVLVVVPGTAGPRGAVVMLHGAGGSGARMADETTVFADDALREGFVAVFPDGTGAPPGFAWNAGSCCAAAAGRDVDDVAWLDALAATVRARLCVDRVVGAGHSNGGMMAHRWSCEGEGVDATLSSAGPLLASTCGGPPRPAVAVHGLADTRVPYEGTPADEAPAFPPARDAFAPLVARNGCVGEPTRTTGEGTVCLVWTCAVETRLCLLDGWRHAWPGRLSGVAGFEAEAEAEGLLTP